MTLLDPAALAAELIRQPSVTPKDEGALDIVAGRLDGSALPAIAWSSAARTAATDRQSLCADGEGRPNLCFAGHTDVVPPGPRRPGRSTRLAPTGATARCVAAARST